MTIALIVAAMVLLLLMQGFFSGSEIAMVHCDKAKLRHQARQGHSGSRLALKMFERPEALLAITLVGTNICLVTFTVLGTSFLILLLGEGADLFAVFVLAPMTLLLGEVVPKSVYQQLSDWLAPRIIFPLYGFWMVFFPIVFVFSRTARFVARLVGQRAPGSGLFAVREQLRAVLDDAEGASSAGLIDKARIQNVIRFGELTVGDVMIPAKDMVSVSVDGLGADAIAAARRTGATHIPVHRENQGNVVGMITLTVWDLMDSGLAKRKIEPMMSPAFFVIEEQSLSELLPVLRERPDQSAVVVDEYGSAVGFIDADMILETIVGDINGNGVERFPRSEEKPGYEDLGGDVYLMDARMPLASLNEILATAFSSSQVHTIGGLVTHRLRHVPKTGEAIVEEGYVFTVIEATEQAATRLRIEKADNP